MTIDLGVGFKMIALNNELCTQQFNNFEVIQQFGQQLQIKAPCLYQEPERARIFEMLLCKRDAVQSAKASPSISSISIHFDPKALPLEKLCILLDTLLSNIGYKVSHSLQQIKSHISSSCSKSASHFILKGLKCPSCAISLEMTLNRHIDIDKAIVDYKSTTLTVHGKLSSTIVCNLVQNAGFEALITDT